MILLENILPLDIIRFINKFVMYEELNDSNFKYVIKLWFEKKELCKFKYGHISYWKTEKVTDMAYIFFGEINFNEYLSNWNVSNVKNMWGMFDNAHSFNSDLSNWNVSNVKNMNRMFRNAHSFNSDLSNWNISNVENMKYMFKNASSFDLKFGPKKLYIQ